MNDRQRDYFRAKLLAWKDEILRESRITLQTLQEENVNHPDLADRASSETDRAIELRARDRQRKLISKIDAALQRIEDNTYGYCEETGEPISLKRLDARPIATLSLEAQERHELEIVPSCDDGDRDLSGFAAETLPEERFRDGGERSGGFFGNLRLVKIRAGDVEGLEGRNPPENAEEQLFCLRRICDGQGLSERRRPIVCGNFIRLFDEIGHRPEGKSFRYGIAGRTCDHRQIVEGGGIRPVRKGTKRRVPRLGIG